MLSNADKKTIRSLKQKKCRDREGLFVVEGLKMVQEALNSTCKVRALYVQSEGLFSGATSITKQQMSEISHFDTPSPALAVVEKEKKDLLQTIALVSQSTLYLGLDSIRDPGNLGTIMRIADWFGISAIFASADTVDCYNPKVIQASMGAIFRVPLFYVDLSEVIDLLSVPVWGTALSGVSLYEANLSSNGVVIIGNESNGISQRLQKKIDRMLMIPSYHNNADTSESLNAAMATAVVCAEFRRRS